MCHIKNDDFSWLIFFFIEILNMKLVSFLHIIFKKILEIMFNHKEDKLIKYNFVSGEVRFLDKIEYSSTVLQRQVSNQLLSIDRFDNPGCRRGNLTLMSYTCNRMKIPWHLDVCSVCVKNNGLEPAYSTISGQSKCLVLRMQSRIINAILKYRV